MAEEPIHGGAQRSGVYQILSGSLDETVGFSIDDVVQDLYEYASPDPSASSRFRALFAKEATVVGAGDDGQLRGPLNVDAYLALRERSGPRLERELSRRTERFGQIAQVFSTYRRDVLNTQERGINSLHLRYDGARWWIVSLLWAPESVEYPLPKRYLP